MLARGLLITSAHESKLPNGSWVLAGFAVDTSDRAEHIPFMWDREKPSDPPVQARICGNLGKVTYLKLQGFLKHTNSTMYSGDCDKKCLDDEMVTLKEHCAVLFPTAEQKAADAAASRSTVKFVSLVKGLLPPVQTWPITLSTGVMVRTRTNSLL